MIRSTRRELLKRSLGLAIGTSTGSLGAAIAKGSLVERETLPVAAVVTTYRRNSHADVIVGKVLNGYLQDGGRGPDLKLVSLFVDQVGSGDLSRDLAAKHGFRLARTIDEALTLGTNQLQIAGVLSIGEHGDYPFTPDTKQHIYPRRRFFDEIVATFRRCGRSVPVFNDKHLSYRWEDARAMYDTAKEMKFPLLAGSSLPVAQRKPVLELPRDADIEAALTIGYGGLESYGFHALEAHQAMIERRRGGESGLVAVQALSGDEIFRSRDAGQWSRELFNIAYQQMPEPRKEIEQWKPKENAAVYLLQHRDGFRSAVVMANGLAGHVAFAAKLKGEATPRATWFQLPKGAPYSHFAHLVHAIDETIHSRRAVSPVERTLLTTGTLDRSMQSLAQAGRRLETSELAIAYEPSDWPFANHPRSTLQLPLE